MKLVKKVLAVRPVSTSTGIITIDVILTNCLRLPDDVMGLPGGQISLKEGDNG